MNENTRPHPQEVEYEEEEEDDLEELNFDTSDIEVKPVDGMLIGGDDEIIKLLFYYKKPGSSVDCRAVVELRTSKSLFIAMADLIFSHLVELVDDDKSGMYS